MADAAEVQTQETIVTPPGGETPPVTPAAEQPPVTTTPTEAAPTTPSVELSEEDKALQKEISDLEGQMKEADTPEQRAELQTEINKRFGKITREKYEARAKLSQAQLEVERLKGFQQGVAEVQKTQPAAAAPGQAQAPVEDKPELLAMPNVEDFADYTAYIDAKFDTAEKNREIVRQFNEAKVAKTRDHEASEAARNQRAVAIMGWMEEGEKKIPGFKTALAAIPVMTDSMHDALADSEVSHQIAQYLSLNPQESRRIGALSPIKQVREILAIESKVKKPPVNSTTKAPAPIQPGGGAGGAAHQIDPETCSMDEYVAGRKSGIIK